MEGGQQFTTRLTRDGAERQRAAITVCFSRTHVSSHTHQKRTISPEDDDIEMADVGRQQDTKSSHTFAQATAHAKSNRQFRFDLQREAKLAPRFLFRTYREGHEDHQTEDTASGVTPRAFEDRSYRRSIFDMPHDELKLAARSHLLAHPRKSYFSSWTNSWQRLTKIIAEHMRMSTAYGMPDVYISIIDTKLLEKSQVVTLHSSFFTKIDRTIQDTPYDFMVYGKIFGDGYRAVSISKIISSDALRDISVGPWPHFTTLRDAIEGAQVFGDCFGKYFALPVAVTLLSFPNDSLRCRWSSGTTSSALKVIKGLQGYRISKTWADDSATRAESHTPRNDVERARFIFRALIEQQFPLKEPEDVSMEDVASGVVHMDLDMEEVTISTLYAPTSVATSSYCPSTRPDIEPTDFGDGDDPELRLPLFLQAAWTTKRKSEC